MRVNPVQIKNQFFLSLTHEQKKSTDVEELAPATVPTEPEAFPSTLYPCFLYALFSLCSP